MIRRRDGFILPTTMLVLLAMVIIVAGGYALTRVQVRQTVYQTRVLQAQEIAQAGLEDALNVLALDSSWKAGYPSPGKAFAGGYYIVSISTDQAPWVTSTGYSRAVAGFGPAARTVSARTMTTSGVYNFAATTFTVNWPITAFNSLVDYSPICQTNKLSSNGCLFGSHIWANATDVVGASGIVNGDAVYATAASTAPVASRVSGSVSYSGAPVTAPIQDGAPYLSANDNLTVGRIVPASAYNSGTMVLSATLAGGAVTLSSGTYYFKGINVTTQTLNISVGVGEKVFIYLAGDLYVSPGGKINSGSNCGGQGGGCAARNFHIYGQGGHTLNFNGNTAVASNANVTYLDLYCPQDNVIINQRFLGRAVGKSVTISNPYGAGNRYPVFFFDTQLGFAIVTGARWVSGTWSESYWKP